jgi:hypothetical protein
MRGRSIARVARAVCTLPHIHSSNLVPSREKWRAPMESAIPRGSTDYMRPKCSLAALTQRSESRTWKLTESWTIPQTHAAPSRRPSADVRGASGSRYLPWRGRWPIRQAPITTRGAVRVHLAGMRRAWSATNVVRAAAQTANVKWSKLFSTSEVYCTACCLCVAEIGSASKSDHHDPGQTSSAGDARYDTPSNPGRWIAPGCLLA